MTGRSLKLFLVDGSPSGVITAELGGSTLKAAVASRTALPDLVARPEASRTGAYVLIGPDLKNPGNQLAYVGESDDVGRRIAEHDADESKDFFERVVLIVCKDENLTKAHARYLESCLLKAIRRAGRVKLVNGTAPDFAGIPEADLADMDRMLGEIEVVLPVLGFDILRPAGVAAAAQAHTSPSNASAEAFVFTESGASARARELGGEFVVLAGYRARRQEVNSCPESVRRKRQALIEDGTLAPSDDRKALLFTRDVAFGSTSGAADVVYGGSASGPRYWKHEGTGDAYGVWRSRRVQAAERKTQQASAT